MNKYFAKSIVLQACAGATLLSSLTGGTAWSQDFLADLAAKLSRNEQISTGYSSIDSSFVRTVSNQTYSPFQLGEFAAANKNRDFLTNTSELKPNSSSNHAPAPADAGSTADDSNANQSPATNNIERNEPPITANANQTIAAANTKETVRLPEHIPTQCVVNAAQRYDVPEMALLAILKQESGGKLGKIGNNSDGSRDFGPAQINDKTWGAHLEKNYGITLNDVLHNPCQAIMVEAYILRIAWNTCAKRNNTDIWCAIATYHSSNPYHQRIYVSSVWEHYKRMIDRGEF
jgi:soluble lytic murein transglycosylase-like protein